MSMDVIVWAACALSLPVDLPQPEKWSNYGRTDWAYETDSWQVIIDIDLLEKPPQSVVMLNKTHTIANLVVLEPIGASNQAYVFLNTVIETIAKRCKGATFEGPVGIVSFDKDGFEIK